MIVTGNNIVKSWVYTTVSVAAFLLFIYNRTLHTHTYRRNVTSTYTMHKRLRIQIVNRKTRRKRKRDVFAKYYYSNKRSERPPNKLSLLSASNRIIAIWIQLRTFAWAVIMVCTYAIQCIFFIIDALYDFGGLISHCVCDDLKWMTIKNKYNGLDDIWLAWG